MIFQRTKLANVVHEDTIWRQICFVMSSLIPIIEDITKEIWCQINFCVKRFFHIFICLEMTPTSSIEMSCKQKTSMFIVYRLDFNSTRIGSALTKVSIKQLQKKLYIAQEMKFSIKDFFSKCDQIRSYGFGHIY